MHPDDNGVVHTVIVMTANHNKLRPDLQPERTTLKRDTTKLALIEYPESNHMTQKPYTTDSNLTQNSIGEKPSFILPYRYFT